jgi:hypothetical protein
VRTIIALLLGAALGGCCNDAGSCPPSDVAIFVSVGEQGVDGVEVEGGDATCVREEEATLCRLSGPFAEGDYDFVVRVPGYEPRPVELAVRTNRPPPFSCECTIPSGSAALQLDGEPAQDQPDEADGGVADGG